MLDLLRMDISMDMVNSIGKMGQYTKDIIDMEWEKDKANFLIAQIVAFLEEFGKKETSKEEDNMLNLRGKLINVYGVMGKLLDSAIDWYFCNFFGLSL